MEEDADDFLHVEGLLDFAIFPVEHGDVAQDATVFEDDVHVLRTHAALGKLRQVALPEFSDVYFHGLMPG